jgi:hypothetical protein
MNFILTRIKDDGVETLGVLESTVPEVIFKCQTLEKPWLNNQHSISCIPAGTYTALWNFMGDMNAYHYELQNVPGRTGIFMHPGNFVVDSEGCILLGATDAIMSGNEMDITSSVLTVEQFETLGDKQPIVITIIGVQ